MTNRKLPTLYSLMKMLVLTSFIGFIVEDTFKIFRNGYFDNRYMFLPFLIGYGFFTIVVGTLLGTPKNFLPLIKKEIKIKTPFNYIMYFFVAAILVTVGELALGYTVEFVAGFHYWDYSRIPLHFTRYTSLPTSLGFGLIITIFMGFIYEPLMHFFETRLNGKKSNIISIVLTSLLALDFLISFIIMIATGERMLLWKITVFNK